MRKEPIKAPTLTEPQSDKVELIWHLRTITPMFGGSATARQVDEKNPIRVPSIRGHLRFWWRAVFGRLCESVTKMYVAEKALFGSDSCEGKVAIDIEIINAGTGAEQISGLDWKAYAGFSFKGNNQQEAAKGRQGVEFRLSVRVPESEQLVIQKTVTYWILFGGIGARTRRGFGSLEIANFSKASSGERSGGKRDYLEVNNFSFRGTMEKAAGNAEPHSFPKLGNYWVRRESCATPNEAWKASVKLYQEFRQGVGVARARGEGRRPGSSYWPEAAAIRELADHGAGVDAVPNGSFPRADLGMPIVMHFDRQEDLADRIIQPKESKRMASPVITKPMQVGPGRYVSVIAILDTPHAWETGVELQPGGDLQSAQIEPDEVTIHRQPLNGVAVRHALAAHAQQSGWIRGNF